LNSTPYAKVPEAANTGVLSEMPHSVVASREDIFLTE